MNKAKPTIRDVARSAGVSKSTVSLVLRGSDKVASKTRRKVLAAVKAVGYVANAAAKSLVTRSSALIGLGVMLFEHSLVDKVYFSSIVATLLDVLRANGYHLMLYNVHAPFELFVDGMVFLGVDLDHPFAQAVRSAGVPYVFINRRTADSTVPFVSQDFRQGAVMATEHLLKLGHRQIGFMSGDPRQFPHMERLLGYRQALQTAGLEDEAIALKLDLSSKGGYLGAKNLLERPNPP